MNLWDWIWSWFHHKPKNTNRTPGTGRSYVAGQPAKLSRSSATIHYLKQPSTAFAQYFGYPPGVKNPQHIVPTTGTETVTGEMPHQTLRVHAPDCGLVVLAGDPPIVTRP